MTGPDLIIDFSIEEFQLKILCFNFSNYYCMYIGSYKFTFFSKFNKLRLELPNNKEIVGYINE